MQTTFTPHQIGQRLQPRSNAANNYLQDRDKQRLNSLSGIPCIAAKDRAVTESMGGRYRQPHERASGIERSLDCRDSPASARLSGSWRAAKRRRPRQATPPPGLGCGYFIAKSAAAA